MRTAAWITLTAAALFAWTGCDPMELDVSDDDTADDDTADDDTADDDTADDDTADDDTGDDDTGDDDTGDDDTTCDLTVPTGQPTIQIALIMASDGDVICVEPGTYYENVDFAGKGVHLWGVGGPAETTLDGGSSGSVVTFDHGEGPDSVLDGFTVTHGQAIGGGGGGGIHVEQSDPTLRNLIVSYNEATGAGGGGIALLQSAATLSNIVVRNNVAPAPKSSGAGGGLWLDQSQPELTNVLIANNQAMGPQSTGGGILDTGSTTTLTNVVLLGNEAHTGGGMAALNGNQLTATNVAVVGNVADEGAGMEFGVKSAGTLTNVLLAHNDAIQAGAILYSGGGKAYPSLSHCAVWDNAAIPFVGMPDPTGDDGNLTATPLLLDTASKDLLQWDLHLGQSSVLVDAGNPNLLDPDGSLSDIGAYGGPGAGGFDLDLDGYFEWWLPGAYDAKTSAGMDCDDGDPAVHPGSGC